MSERRFKLLIKCLRFDSKVTRDERKESDKLAAVPGLWKLLLQRCRENYKPGSYLIIEEQRVGF